jgi:hypothetical protein
MTEAQAAAAAEIARLGSLTIGEHLTETRERLTSRQRAAAARAARPPFVPRPFDRSKISPAQRVYEDMVAASVIEEQARKAAVRSGAPILAAAQAAAEAHRASVAARDERNAVRTYWRKPASSDASLDAAIAETDTAEDAS